MVPTEVVPRSGESSRSRLQFLDAIRGLAALVVAIGHFVEVAAPAYFFWSYEHVSLGRMGVVAFFVVSGYVIPMSLERSTIGTFWISRVFRLYPAYWAAIIVFTVLALTGLGAPPQLSAAAAVFNVLMLQMFIAAPNFVPPAWTLGIELLYYAQGTALKAVSRTAAGPLMGYVWLAGFVAAGAVAPALGHENLPISVPLLLFTACLGHGVFLWERDRMSGAALLTLLFSGLASLVVVSWISFGIFPGASDQTVLGPVQWSPVGYVLSYCAGLLLFGVFFAMRSRRFPAVMTWLGQISFSLYLIHPAVYTVITHWLPAASLPAIVLYLTALPLCAWLLYRGVEKPAVILGRRVRRARR